MPLPHLFFNFADQFIGVNASFHIEGYFNYTGLWAKPTLGIGSHSNF